MKILKWSVALLVIVIASCNGPQEEYSIEEALTINNLLINEFIVFDEHVSIAALYQDNFKNDFSNWTNRKVKRIIDGNYPIMSGQMSSYNFQNLRYKFLHISNQWLVRLLSNKRNKKDGAYIIRSIEGVLTVKVAYSNSSKANAYAFDEASKLKDFKSLQTDLENYLRSEQAEKFSSREELYILEEPIYATFSYHSDNEKEKLVTEEIGRRITIFPKSTILKDKKRFDNKE